MSASCPHGRANATRASLDVLTRLTALRQTSMSLDDCLVRCQQRIKRIEHGRHKPTGGRDRELDLLRRRAYRASTLRDRALAQWSCLRFEFLQLTTELWPRYYELTHCQRRVPTRGRHRKRKEAWAHIKRFNAQWRSNVPKMLCAWRCHTRSTDKDYLAWLPNDVLHMVLDYTMGSRKPDPQ